MKISLSGYVEVLVACTPGKTGYIGGYGTGVQ